MGLWSKGIDRSLSGECRLEDYRWDKPKIDIIRSTIDLLVANIRRHPERTCEYIVKPHSVKWNILGYDICEYFYRDDYVDNERLMVGKIMVSIFDMLQACDFKTEAHQLTFGELHKRIARALSYAPTEEDRFWTYIDNC